MQRQQSSTNVQILDCLGNPIVINHSLRAKEVARVESKIVGKRSNVAPAMWTRWMTDETEGDLKHKAFRHQFLRKIGKVVISLRKRSTDPTTSHKARRKAAQKLQAAESIGLDSTDVIEIAKALGMTISPTALRILK